MVSKERIEHYSPGGLLAVTKDNDGNSYVGIAGNNLPRLAKFSPAGKLIWLKQVGPTGTIEAVSWSERGEVAAAVNLDGVYAAATKISASTGNVLWRTVSHPPSLNHVHWIGEDALGRVTMLEDEQGLEPFCNLYQYSATDGAEKWHLSLDGAGKIVLDGHGNACYLGGQFEKPYGSKLIRIDGKGKQQSQSLPGPKMDPDSIVRFFDDGDVLIQYQDFEKYSSGGASTGIAIARYSSNGVRKWAQRTNYAPARAQCYIPSQVSPTLGVCVLFPELPFVKPERLDPWAVNCNTGKIRWKRSYPMNVYGATMNQRGDFFLAYYRQEDGNWLCKIRGQDGRMLWATRCGDFRIENMVATPDRGVVAFGATAGSKPDTNDFLAVKFR